MPSIKILLATTGLIVGLPLLAASVSAAEKTVLSPIWRADVLLGTDIVSESGRSLGVVSDVVVREDSEFSYVIATLGPWCRSEDALRALPWTVLRTDGAVDVMRSHHVAPIPSHRSASSLSLPRRR